MKNYFLIKFGKNYIVNESSCVQTLHFQDFYIEYSYDSKKVPFHVFEDDSYIIVIDGHFYFEESTDLDINHNIKLLISNIKRYQTSFLHTHKFSGLCNIIVLEKNSKTLHITGDWFGFVPLYFKENEKYLLLASKVDYTMDQDFDPEIEKEYLMFGYLPLSDSFSSKIYQKKNRTYIVKSTIDSFSIENKSNTPIKYNKESERHIESKEIAHTLYELFNRYFERIKESSIAIGLSGGYDSRLCCAFSCKSDPFLFNFGNPESPECLRAFDVASTLRLPLKQFKIDPFIVREYSYLYEVLRQPVSLELAHVFREFKEIEGGSFETKIDGFLGGAIMGETYYNKYTKGSYINNLKTIMFDSKDHKLPKKDTIEYHRLPEHLLSLLDYISVGNPKKDLNVILSKIKKFIEEQYSYCWTLNDLRESFLFYTRGKNLITAGPVGGQIYTTVACPFIDYDIFMLCMNSSKKVRSNLILYNKFWRDYFPELAKIKKDCNNSNSYDSVTLLKLRLLYSKVNQFFIKRIVKKSQKINSYSDPNSYYQKNKFFFDEITKGDSVNDTNLLKIRKASLRILKKEYDK